MDACLINISLCISYMKYLFMEYTLKLNVYGEQTNGTVRGDIPQTVGCEPRTPVSGLLS